MKSLWKRRRNVVRAIWSPLRGQLTPSGGIVAGWAMWTAGFGLYAPGLGLIVGGVTLAGGALLVQLGEQRQR